MDYVIVTPPTAEPVTAIGDAGAWARVDRYDEGNNGLITSMIPAARQLVETHANRTLVQTTYRGSLECFPASMHAWRLLNEGFYVPDRPYLRNRHHYLAQRQIELPRPPLQSVTSVQYIDEAGQTQSLVEDVDFTVDTVGEPGRIVPAYGKDWPATRFQPGAVQITFVAGYAANLIPAAALAAIRMLVVYWFNNPAAVGAALEEQPLAARTLIAAVAVPRIY